MIHPLLRGADLAVYVCFGLLYDSSPLTRGRRNTLVYFVLSWRFIPSCEGQASRRKNVTTSGTIHPLIRGADQIPLAKMRFIHDLSPLTRGRHLFDGFAAFLKRFIPSHEGQTSLKAFLSMCYTIHPLLRWEDIIAFCKNNMYNDSSPPARGRQSENLPASMPP